MLRARRISPPPASARPKPNGKAALRRVKFDGEPDAIESLRTVFSLSED
jgi:hypothetical protein